MTGLQQFTLISRKSFEETLANIDSAIGHPNVPAFMREVASTRSDADLQDVVGQATGPSGLIEFIRFEFSAILRTRRSVRLIVGNPIIVKQLLERVADAGLHAPVTILIDERPNGVYVSYDKMAAYLERYGNADASKIARDLDSKVESLLTTATK
jgi:uncharacterized protein DUF302